MSSSLGREKALPNIPVDIDNHRTVTRHAEAQSIPASSTNPSRVVKSKGEACWQNELWNEAGLSARAHRRKYRGQNTTQCQISAPISTPEQKDISLSTADATISRMGNRRKRWGFLSTKSISEKQETGKKSLGGLERLRAIAKDRPGKKLQNAKSTPNLRNGGAQRVDPGLPVLNIVKAVPDDGPARDPSVRSPPKELATAEAMAEPEEMDKNGIYFTVDPTWRVSQGSVRFQLITHVPGDRPTSLWRPDSPLLRRHQSLHQAPFAHEIPVIYGNDEILHPIDELYTYPEL